MIHVPSIPLIPLVWNESWTPSTGTTPHVKTFTYKKLSGVVIHYAAVGNADVVRGIVGSARPQLVQGFEVAHPRGYEVVEDCVRIWPNVWPTMRVAVRRYALYPRNRPDLYPEAVREAHGIYTTRWRRAREDYGPTGIPLPNLTSSQLASEAAKVSLWLAEIRKHLQNGTHGGTETVPTGGWDYQEGPVTPLPFGWRGWGPVRRDEQAGSGVFWFTGHEQAPDMPAYCWLASSGNFERWWHVLDRNTGEPITADNYGDPGPMYQVGSQTLNNRFLPEVQGVAPANDPLQLPYDASHSIRGYRHTVAMSEFTNHPVIGWMLRSIAAQFRLQYSERGPHQSQGQNYVPPSLRRWLQDVIAVPGRGFFGQDTGRMLGEPATVIAQSIKRGGASENRPWATMFCQVVETGVMENGIFSRSSEPGPPIGTTTAQWEALNVWYHHAHDLAHSFEVSYLMHGYFACARVTGRQIPPKMFRYAESLYEKGPMLPYYGGVGPPQYAFVAARGGAGYPDIPGGKNNAGDSTAAHVGAALAAHMNPAQRQRWISAGLRVKPITDLRESAGLLGQIQRA